MEESLQITSFPREDIKRNNQPANFTVSEFPNNFVTPNKPPNSQETFIKAMLEVIINSNYLIYVNAY
jgi:hypothetical protein